MGAALAAGSATAAYAEQGTDTGKLEIITSSGKHACLFPAGDNEWRISITPAAPKDEMPPVVCKIWPEYR